MIKKNRTVLVFADVQQDIPQYLCMDEGGIYLCTVGQQDGGFIEQKIQRVDTATARIFIARAFNKAMATIRAGRIDQA